jgi:hypothetical protein
VKAAMKKRAKYLIVILAVTLAAYVGSYAIFRSNHVEIWEEDNQAYVIFPEDNISLYYFYRPLTYADALITGVRFHIGPHR